tara:strand:- start:633 stop:1034 length:402 start_codon:yes stop_codon:yes gene_type:complete
MKILPPKFYLVIHNASHAKVVQDRLFDLGFYWIGLDRDRKDLTHFPIDFIEVNAHSKGRMVRKQSDDSRPTSQLISMDDLFEMQLKPDFSEVKLNSEYSAKVYKDKIVVGCQTFSVGIIDDLVLALKEINSNI